MPREIFCGDGGSDLFYVAVVRVTSFAALALSLDFFFSVPSLAFCMSFHQSGTFLAEPPPFAQYLSKLWRVLPQFKHFDFGLEFPSF
jgi:hypothetical protein